MHHMRPVHPGEILRLEYLPHRTISADKLGLDERTFDDLLNERIDVTPFIAAQLSNALGTSDEFWLNLQKNYEQNLPLQNSFPSLLPGVELRNVVPPPYLAKLLAQTTPITGPVKASNLTEVRAKLKEQMHKENYTHDEVFGSLKEEKFSVSEAAEYLDISESVLLTYVQDGTISAFTSSERKQYFKPENLKAFKRSLKDRNMITNRFPTLLNGEELKPMTPPKDFDVSVHVAAHEFGVKATPLFELDRMISKLEDQAHQDKSN